MTFDERVHDVFENFTKPTGVRWHDFHEVGIDEPYYLYYYAEDELYVIRDVMVDTFAFVEARSPAKALAKYKERLEEAMKAGSYYQEDEEYD